MGFEKLAEARDGFSGARVGQQQARDLGGVHGGAAAQRHHEVGAGSRQRAVTGFYGVGVGLMRGDKMQSGLCACSRLQQVHHAGGDFTIFKKRIQYNCRAFCAGFARQVA